LEKGQNFLKKLLESKEMIFKNGLKTYMYVTYLENTPNEQRIRGYLLSP
jgi:hypothetical protein